MNLYITICCILLYVVYCLCCSLPILISLFLMLTLIYIIQFECRRPINQRIDWVAGSSVFGSSSVRLIDHHWVGVWQWLCHAAGLANRELLLARLTNRPTMFAEKVHVNFYNILLAICEDL